MRIASVYRWWRVGEQLFVRVSGKWLSSTLSDTITASITQAQLWNSLVARKTAVWSNKRFRSTRAARYFCCSDAHTMQVASMFPIAVISSWPRRKENMLRDIKLCRQQRMESKEKGKLPQSAPFCVRFLSTTSNEKRDLIKYLNFVFISSQESQRTDETNNKWKESGSKRQEEDRKKLTRLVTEQRKVEVKRLVKMSDDDKSSSVRVAVR